MSENVNITVKVNDIEMVVPSEEDVLSVGRDRLLVLSHHFYMMQK
ncbi:hypothetical protein [Roseburia hominis]